MGSKKNKVPAQPTTKTDTGLFGTSKTGSFGSTFNPTDFQKEYTGMTEQAILNAQNAINNREIAQEAVDNMNRQYQTDFQNQLLAPALSKGWLRGSTAQDVATVANQDYQNRRYDLVNQELARQNEQLANALAGYTTMYDIAKGTTGLSNAANQLASNYVLKQMALNNSSNSNIGSLIGNLAGSAAGSYFGQKGTAQKGKS